MRNLDIRIEVADVRQLSTVEEVDFDVAVSLGNSFCMIESYSDLVLALTQVRMKLREGGFIIAGIRDYSAAINERPLRVDGLTLCSDKESGRVVHQVWQWIDSVRYIAHVYIDRDGDHYQYSVPCRAVFSEEVTEALNAAGFVNVCWLPQDAGSQHPGVHESGFDQLIVVAERPQSANRPRRTFDQSL